MVIYPGNCISNLLKIKLQKILDCYLKPNHFLNKQPLLSLYYSYIHSYIKYANVVWGSTYMTNLKKLPSQQNPAIELVSNKGKFEHTKQLLQSKKILNVYKLNILNAATFCIRSIKNLLQIFFFQGFKNRLILILLDLQNLTTCNQSTILKRINTQFQLQDHISEIVFLAPKRNKSLLSINLKL